MIREQVLDYLKREQPIGKGELSRHIALVEFFEAVPDLQARLTRIESMLAYLLGTTEATQTTEPTTEQAKQLAGMGLPPWPRITRKTNHLEIWKEGFLKSMAAQAAKGEQDNEKPW